MLRILKLLNETNILVNNLLHINEYDNLMYDIYICIKTM